MSEPLLSVDNLHVHFKIPEPGFFKKPNTLKAVNGISFELEAGQTLGVVGESGCGKSTLARGVLGLLPVTSGQVYLEGQALVGLKPKAMRALRQDMQIIFQDPLASLNPRMTVGHIISEPLKTFHKGMTRLEREKKVLAVMDKVGLSASHINRYPHEFSGGQCQRIGIARALILKPKLIVCDEPVSALDVSIQAQIVNLLMDLQQELGLALLFIAHDLSVVRHISHKVMVMYLGRAVEMADKQSLYESPAHPYTQALLKSVPIPDPALAKAMQAPMLKGDVPSPLDLPSGCAFRTRCVHAQAVCEQQVPELTAFGTSRAACVRLNEVNI